MKPEQIEAALEEIKATTYYSERDAIYDGAILSSDGLHIILSRETAETVQFALRLALRVMGEPSEAMWDGLARAIVMGRDLRCNQTDEMRKHLEHSGYKVEGWLETELCGQKHLAKGDIAVLVFQAMRDQLLKEVRDDNTN